MSGLQAPWLMRDLLLWLVRPTLLPGPRELLLLLLLVIEAQQVQA